MKNEKSNNNLQSRREFFRNAAKAALPILGAIVLTQTPLLTKAAEISMTCENTCSTQCAENCHGQCVESCRDKCETSCKNKCVNGCLGTCEYTCKHTCVGTSL